MLCLAGERAEGLPLDEPSWFAIELGDRSVKQFNQFAWVSLGKAIGPLMSLDLGDGQDGKIDLDLKLLQAQNWLDAVRTDGIVPLDTCKHAATQLHAQVVSFRSYLDTTDKPEPLVVALTASRMRSSTTEFLSILNAELDKASVYYVAKKRIYDTNDLISQAHKLFSQSVLDVLPPNAKDDVDQAGKCLAFEVPTSAGFHILRASESVMGLYYQTLTKGQTFKDDKIMRNWGAYIEALRKNGAEKKVTEFLDHIRGEYRNPITHPEDVLTLDQALDLFNAEISSISQIISQVIVLRGKP
jgi:hypothetical protein